MSARLAGAHWQTTFPRICVTKTCAVWAGVALVAASGFLLLPSSVSAADQRLADAVKRQDTAAISALLKQRVDVNAPQPDGTTAIHWAVHHDAVATVEALIRAGANVNAATDAGVTPLWVACTSNARVSIVRLLVGAGAEPSVAPDTGETPLMWCARTNAADAIKALVAHGADVNAREKSSGQTALMWAVAARHPEVARMLLEAGADPRARSNVTTELVYKGYRFITSPPAHAKGIIETVKRGGFTPLLFAAQQGDQQSAELLLAAGANINDTDASGASADPNAAGAGYTPLHAAVLRGDLALVRALLARGADPDTVLAAGTPVRKYGVDYALNAAWIGATPYWLAAKFAESEIMRSLAAAKADTRRPIPDGTTPLMATLMRSPAQGDRRERFRTEVQMAAAAPTQDAETLAAATTAMELGADVRAASHTGDTALHMAATRGALPVIELLVSAGAPLDAKNTQGQTPLAAAASRRGPGDFDGDATAAASTQTRQTVDLLRSLGAKE